MSQVSENKARLTCLGRWDEANLSEDPGCRPPRCPCLSKASKELALSQDGVQT